MVMDQKAESDRGLSLTELLRRWRTLARHPRIAIMTVAVVIGLLVVGCGSSGSPDSSAQRTSGHSSSTASTLPTVPASGDVRGLAGRVLAHEPSCAFDTTKSTTQGSPPSNGVIGITCGGQLDSGGNVLISTVGKPLSGPRSSICQRVHPSGASGPVYACGGHSADVLITTDGSTQAAALTRFKGVIALVEASTAAGSAGGG